MVADLQGQLKVGEERAAAAVEERNEALKSRDATQKDLSLKTFALKKSQKVRFTACVCVCALRE